MTDVALGDVVNYQAPGSLGIGPVAAIVTKVYDDGSADLRTFGSYCTGTMDVERAPQSDDQSPGTFFYIRAAAHRGHFDLFGGHIQPDGTMDAGQAGWTGTRLGAGNYQVTYDVPRPDVGFIVAGFQAIDLDFTKPAMINVVASDANGFTLQITDQAGGKDYAVTFLAALPPLA